MAWSGRVRAAVPWLLGAGLGLVALGPAAGRGFVLRYDMVAVPEPPLGPVQLGAGDGFPRAVPSDAVFAVLAKLIPADLVQTLVVVGAFAIAAAGAARLIPSGGSAEPAESAAEGRWRAGGRFRATGPALLAARCAAAVFYVWNPFVAERLLLGQWAVLVGYAGLPWVLAAAAEIDRRRGFARFVVALVPAAVGGFSSAILSGLVALPAAAIHTARRVRAAVLVPAAIALVSLPWLIPALSGAGSGTATDPAAVGAFAPRADTPFGAAASLLALGGIWNAQAVPPLHGHPYLAAARLVLAVAAIAGWCALARSRQAGPAGTGLGASAAIGLLVALAGTTEAGRSLLAALIGLWPGFGPLRDGQLYIAPLALLQSVGAGALALLLAGGAASAPGTAARGGGAAAGGFAAVLLLAVPLVSVPGLVWGAGGRLAPSDYPPAWSGVQEAVDGDPAPGAVLVLPWSAHRGLDWAGDGQRRVVLDPAAKMFERRTVWNDELRVADSAAGGRVTTVAGEDPLARRAAARAAGGPLGAHELGALGIRYVLVERDALAPGASSGPDTYGDNTFSVEAAGLEVVRNDPAIALLRVPDPHVAAVNERLSGLEVTGWLVTVGSITLCLAVSRSHLIPRRPLRQ